MHCLFQIALLLLLPLGILFFWAVFAAILWPWQAHSHTDRDEPTDKHSERIYRDFEFFIKAFLAIVGAFGYIRIEKYDLQSDLIRTAMIGLGSIGLAVAWLFGIFIICHQGSKLRRWGTRDKTGKPCIEWNKMPFWQEIWMCLGMLGFATVLWIAAFEW
jgi:hypothetical protein